MNLLFLVKSNLENAYMLVDTLYYVLCVRWVMRFSTMGYNPSSLDETSEHGQQKFKKWFLFYILFIFCLSTEFEFFIKIV